jgi:hypothetical protein
MTNPVDRIRAIELERLKRELAPEAAAIKTALATEEQGLKTALMAALEVGERLSRARKRAPHGLWLPWLAAEFPKTAATARRYMRLFELSKSYNLQHLRVPPSALYLLTAECTDGKVRDDILRRAEEGEEFSFDDIDEMLAESKGPKVKLEIFTSTVELPPPRKTTKSRRPKQANPRRRET